MKKFLIEGAMDIETDYLIEKVKELPEYEVFKEDGFEFHIGKAFGKKYIITKTGMGSVNAAMATAFACRVFHPTLVISQGTAGAQLKDLSTGDLVVVDKAININNMKTPKKEIGEGSNPLEWIPTDMTYYESDQILVDLFMEHVYKNGRMIRGNVATGDFFSREADRIISLQEKFNTVSEDMETAVVYQVCNRFETPCMALRIISNNEINGEEFNGETARLLQEHVWHVVWDHL